MSQVQYPLTTEKAMEKMDEENKLQFIVELDATKPEIRDEIEERFDTDVTNVNTMVTPQAEKKAAVRFAEAGDAEDIASRIGVF